MRITKAISEQIIKNALLKSKVLAEIKAHVVEW